MGRSPITEADQALLDALADVGLTVSRFQFERWRHRGLLGRAVTTRQRGRGSRVEPHRIDDYLAARVLAHSSKQGESWQAGGLALFEDGLPMTQECLRACARWQADALRRRLGPLWEQALGDMSPGALSDDEVLADIAARAEDLAERNRGTRDFLGQVRRDLERLRFYSDKEGLEAAAREALGLRLADMTGAHLSPGLKRIARYGSEEVPTPPFPLVLHSDKTACADTLTAREAYLMRRWHVSLHKLGALPDFLADLMDKAWLLELAVLETVGRRVAEPPYGNPRVPLTTPYLDDFEEDVIDAERDAQGGSSP